MGDDIAASSEVRSFRGGRLKIGVEHTAWLQELRLRREEIANRLNARLGRPEVREVRIETGKRLGRGLVSPRRRPPPRLPPALEEAVQGWASTVKDDELRRLLIRLATRSLALDRTTDRG